MITEFGEFGFELDGKEVSLPVYSFIREPSNHLSFRVKIKGRWRNIYYWNSPKDPCWLWASKPTVDEGYHYEIFPYKVTKFYYNTVLEAAE